jgi:hypothetical protein
MTTLATAWFMIIFGTSSNGPIASSYIGAVPQNPPFNTEDACYAAATTAEYPRASSGAPIGIACVKGLIKTTN